jgi:signal transduction histidine kinase
LSAAMFDLHVLDRRNILRLISVSDTGIGIKQEVPKLFREFTQLGSVYAKVYEGT